MIFKLITFIKLIGLITAYAPKLILISFDGFRGDYLNPKLAPTIHQLSKDGVQTRMMKSCYVTKTFPNHFSIVTGLYEENHGIVNNKMYDPKLNDTFQMSNLQERWWDSDQVAAPIWSLNENFGKDRVSASSMWPGSPIEFKNGRKPKYLKYFERGISFIDRMDQVINWLIKDKEPANFVLLYIDEPDETSHKYGPLSPEVREKIKELDYAVKHLLKRLKEVDLIDETNLIILSDHGMSEIREDRVVDLTKYCNVNEFILSGVSPNLNLFFKDKKNIDKAYDQLKIASEKLPFLIYKKGEVPSQYHFNNHRRIGDLVIEAKEGYEVIINMNQYTFDSSENSNQKKKLNPNYSSEDSPKMDVIEKFEDFLIRKNETTLRYWGDHGYNNSIKDMRPLFLAHGPAFKKGYTHRTPFENIDVYSLMCSVLHLNLDPELKSSDRYCIMDGQPNRVSKMLQPIKYTGDELEDSKSEKSFNILLILLLGALLLALSGCLFTLCISAGTNRTRKKKLYNIDLDEDIINIDLSQLIFKNNKKQKNSKFSVKNEEEREGLISSTLEYV